MPVYDTDIEDVIEEEKRFVGKGGFGREEDNIEDVVVVANDLFISTDSLNSIPTDNVPAGRSSSIPADYVSAGHVLIVDIKIKHEQQVTWRSSSMCSYSRDQIFMIDMTSDMEAKSRSVSWMMEKSLVLRDSCGPKLRCGEQVYHVFMISNMKRRVVKESWYISKDHAGITVTMLLLSAGLLMDGIGVQCSLITTGGYFRFSLVPTARYLFLLVEFSISARCYITVSADCDRLLLVLVCCVFMLLAWSVPAVWPGLCCPIPTLIRASPLVPTVLHGLGDSTSSANQLYLILFISDHSMEPIGSEVYRRALLEGKSSAYSYLS
ncbi:hypothetical protein Tco_0155115 [Tanacetum coccineum]